MATTIQSGAELYNLLSALLGEQYNNGWACPWCEQKGEYEVSGKETSDRLFISTRFSEERHPIRFVCRQASQNAVDHAPVHSIEELFQEFTDKLLVTAPGTTWFALAHELLALVGAGISGDVDPSKAFWTLEEAYAYHKDGMQQWIDMGFSLKTIKRLFLGTRAGRLTIPIPYLALDEQSGGLTPTGQYVQRTRQINVGPKYHWPSNLAPTLWYIQGKEEWVKIVEGDTSAIASLQIWDDGPIATAQGSSSWSDAMTKFLLEKGHRQFKIFYDNDTPGHSYAQLIIKSFRRVVEHLPHIGWDDLDLLLVLWPDETKEGADPRSILAEYGEERAKVLLEQWIVPNGWYSMRQPNHGRLNAILDEEYAVTDYATDVEAERDTLTELDILRGRGKGSIYEEIEYFTEKYTVNDEGEGQLLLVRSTPGTGKTRAAVLWAESWARKYIAKREKAAERIIDKLLLEERTPENDAKIEKYRNGEYKKHSVLFVGPFKDGFDDILNHAEDSSLWYNLEARSPSNCKNYGFATKIAQAGYPIMTSLCVDGGACGKREACLQRDTEGVLQYMGQLNELERYPIIYARHNHLRMKSLMDSAQVIIVDEDPSSVSMGSIQMTVEDVEKLDPSVMLDSADALHTQRLVNGLIEAMKSWGHTQRYLRGRALVSHIDITEGPYSLHEIAKYMIEYKVLEKIADWHPENDDEVESAPHGKIATLLAILVRDVLREEEDWNSQLFIEENAITFYPMDSFSADPRKPVIALDATGIREKYELCFGRMVQEFRAEVFPANARTVVITNTESTMNTLLSDIGTRDEEVRSYGEREWATQPKTLAPIDFGIFEDPVKIKNPAMRDMLKLALGLTYQHGRLLLVTYKTGRKFAEAFIKKNFPEYYDRMGFGHFKALRGLNIFEDMPAVLVAGTPRVPPQVLRRDLEALHHQDPELLNLQALRVDEYYHHTPWRYSTMKLTDQRTHPLIDEIEAGEIEQVAGRIRAAVHDDPANPKHIYLLTARPALRWHSYYGPGTEGYAEDGDTDISFMTMQQALWRYVEVEQSTALIKAYIKEFNRVPSMRKLAEWGGITLYKAKKIRNHWDITNE